MGERASERAWMVWIGLGWIHPIHGSLLFALQCSWLKLLCSRTSHPVLFPLLYPPLTSSSLLLPSSSRFVDSLITLIPSSSPDTTTAGLKTLETRRIFISTSIRLPTPISHSPSQSPLQSCLIKRTGPRGCETGSRNRPDSKSESKRPLLVFRFSTSTCLL